MLCLQLVIRFLRRDGGRHGAARRGPREAQEGAGGAAVAAAAGACGSAAGRPRLPG